MFCGNCGAEIKEDALFCENCGTAIGNTRQHIVLEDKERQFAFKLSQKNRKYIIIAGVFMIICIAVFSGSNSRKYINVVKQGSNEYYNQMTTGEVFQTFFEDSKWKYNSSTKLVEATGKCLYDNVPVKAKIEYYVYDNETFALKAISLDDGYTINTLSERGMISFLSDVYESAYRDKGLEPPGNLGDILDGWDILTDFFAY